MTTEWDRDVRAFFMTLVRERSEQLAVALSNEVSFIPAQNIGSNATLLDEALKLADAAEKARKARRDRPEFTITQDFRDLDPDVVARAFADRLQRYESGPG